MRSKVNSGQVLPILALVFVALLGVTALAIDGSMTYSDRRTSQSTADSAALAGAGAAAQILKDYSPSKFYCGSALGAQASTAAVIAAQNAALADEITLSTNMDDLNYVHVSCHMGQFSNYLDIDVQVTSETITQFGKIVSADKIVSVVDATSRVYPKQTLAFGNAIASLSHSCGKIGGIYLEGNSAITIYQGGVFSNSCLEGRGNIELMVEDASIQYYTAFAENGSAEFDPDPEQTDTYLPEINIDPPNCTGLTSKGSILHSANISPGIFSKIKVNNGETLNMAPGLYCMDGDFEANGHAYIKGDNVTIYMRQGNFKLEGTATVELSAPNCETSLCGVPPAIRGILIFVDPTNNNSVKFSGTPDSYFMGTIYVPSGYIEISGTGDYVTLQTQLIGNRVSVVGNADIILNMDGAEIYQEPSSIELLK